MFNFKDICYGEIPVFFLNFGTKIMNTFPITSVEEFQI